VALWGILLVNKEKKAKKMPENKRWALSFAICICCKVPAKIWGMDK
jgi:hypothetical protein